MADDNRLSAKSGIDTTDFKTGIAQMNRELRVLESGFRASAAEFGDWSRDASGLELRIKSLTSQIDIQKQKVVATRSEYERVAAEKGKTSRAAQDLEIKLNKETETLNKMERELGQNENALNKLTNETEDLGDEQVQTTRTTVNLGAALKTMGSVASTTVGAMVASVKTVVAMTAAIAGLTIGLATFTVGPASDLNETISKTEVVFGDAADKVLAFGESSAEALGLSQNAALSAAGTYGNLLRAMGLSEDASSDMSMSLVELAADLASFNNMDPTEVLEKLRAGLTGETEPLKTLGINMSQARLETKALELGLIQKGQALDAAAKAQAAYAIMMEDTALAQGDFARTSEGLANQERILRATIEDLRAEIGTAFLPIVTLGAQALTGFLQSATVTDGVQELVGWIERLGNILSLAFGDNADLGTLSSELTSFVGDLLGALASMAGDLAPVALDMLGAVVEAIIGAVPTLLPVAVELISKLAGFIVQMLPMLIQAGLQIVVSLAQAIVQQLPALIPVVIEALLTIINTLIENLPMLIEAALQAVIALATGIADALPELIPAVVQALITIVETLIENLPMLIEAATMLIMGLAEGLIIALPFLIDVAPDLMKALVDAIMTALPQFATAAGKLVGMLAYGILANIPVLLTSAGKMIANLLSTLANIPKLVVEVGKGIIDGLISGLSEAQGLLYDAITDIANNALNKIKETLGIASPSKEGKKIGKNLIASTALGGMEAMQDVGRAFAWMTRQLAFAAAGGAAGLRSANGPQMSTSTVTTDNSFDVWGNVIIQGDVSRDSLGATLKGKRY